MATLHVNIWHVRAKMSVFKNLRLSVISYDNEPVVEGFLLNYTGGCADGNAVIRHILIYNGIGTNPAVISDFDIADNLRPRANVHMVADNGASLIAAVGQLVASNGHLLEDHSIFADLRMVRDKHAQRPVGHTGRARKFRRQAHISASVKKIPCVNAH